MKCLQINVFEFGFKINQNERKKYKYDWAFSLNFLSCTFKCIKLLKVLHLCIWFIIIKKEYERLG